jgi:hypothetical protein
VKPIEKQQRSSPCRSRPCHVVKSGLSRAATRETALVDKCLSPSKGFSAVRMRRLLAPAK